MEYNYYYSKDLGLPELHRASKSGERAKVKRLLKGGANPDERGSHNITPLMWAANGGSRDIVADLLKAGASVKAIDDNKRIALHHAAEQGRDEVVADLLAAGASVKAVDMLGMTALHLAALADSPDCIAMLAKGGVNPNCKNKDGYTPLHFAAAFGHPAAMRTLVKNGADASIARRDNGLTALHMAAMEGARVSVQVLFDCRVNLDAKDKQGDTAMHRAAFFGRADVVDALIVAGAKVNLLNKLEETPLLLAQHEGHTKTADLLISADKGINAAKEPDGDSIAERVFRKAWRHIVFIRSSGGTASGVIVAPGLVATNLHVAERKGIRIFGAGESKVLMPFRKTTERGINEQMPYFPTGICAESPLQDFCLLEVPGLGGEEINIRASHTLRVGEEVYAIGNPMEVDLTLSSGIISQLRDNGWKNCREIQTDAATSPGSSGGGLFDRDGNLIGITTGGVGRKKGAQNLSFAIPADLIWGFLPDLRQQKPAAKGKRGKKR